MSISSTTSIPRQPRTTARRQKAWRGKDRRVRLADARLARAQARVESEYMRDASGEACEKAVAARLRRAFQSVAAWRRANR
jgi:hypothetical protein